MQSLSCSKYTRWPTSGFATPTAERRRSALTPARQYGFLFSLVLLWVFSGCVSSGRIPWPHATERAYRGFRVVEEPGLSPQTVQDTLDRAADWRTEIEGAFFPAATGHPIGLVIYATAQSYRSNAHFHLDTLAHYERAENRIHITLKAPSGTWRHELTHALLEQGRANSPYWLHEGLAFLVMDSDLRGSRTCSSRPLARLPAMLHAGLNVLREREQLNTAAIFDADQQTIYGSEALLVSAYFTLYLWNRGLLGDTLRRYQEQPGSAFDMLMVGSNLTARAALIADFEIWVRATDPAVALPGC